MPNVFIDVLFSSSNFLIKSPVQTATAAAGVDSFNMYFSIFSNASFNVEISFGSAAKLIDVVIQKLFIIKKLLLIHLK